MELKKLVLATAVFGALGGLYGCSGDEEANIVIDDNSVVNNTTTNNDNTDTGETPTGITCPDFASVRPVDGTEMCQLPSTILENVTLTADVPWYMDGRVTVGNGNQAMSVTDGFLDDDGSVGPAVTSAILTIEAGTSVFANTGTFANLLITRGSQLLAVGTASDPIVFSSADDGFDGVGEWGGIILHGYAKHNQCSYPGEFGTAAGDPVACNIDAEGESGFAGGHDDSDSSGILNYVVVAEGGFEFAVGNEINGISFVGVGSGTDVDFVQVHNNADDGVEFYGGTVNAKHLVLTGNQDESIDWDEGYTGNIQYAIVVQNANSDHGIEADTEGSLLFLSRPTVANALFLADGDGLDATHRMKATTGGFVHNTVIAPAADAGAAITACIDIQGGGAIANAGTSLDYTNIIAVCDDFEQQDGVAAASIATDTIFSIADAAVDANYASQAAEAAGVTLDIAAYNASNSESLADETFFDATDFIGAVNPDGSDLWFQGWIIDGSL